MAREIYKIPGDPGEMLTITVLDNGHIAYSFVGIGELGVPEVIKQGTVHNPENDDKIGAARVLPTLPITMRSKLTEALERRVQ